MVSLFRVVLSVALATAIGGAEELMAPPLEDALELNDECGSGAGMDACSLNALQLRVSQKSSGGEDAVVMAGSVTAPQKREQKQEIVEEGIAAEQGQSVAAEMKEPKRGAIALQEQKQGVGEAKQAKGTAVATQQRKQDQNMRRAKEEGEREQAEAEGEEEGEEEEQAEGTAQAQVRAADREDKRKCMPVDQWCGDSYAKETCCDGNCVRDGNLFKCKAGGGWPSPSGGACTPVGQWCGNTYAEKRCCSGYQCTRSGGIFKCQKGGYYPSPSYPSPYPSPHPSLYPTPWPSPSSNCVESLQWCGSSWPQKKCCGSYSCVRSGNSYRCEQPSNSNSGGGSGWCKQQDASCQRSTDCCSGLSCKSTGWFTFSEKKCK